MKNPEETAEEENKRYGIVDKERLQFLKWEQSNIEEKMKREKLQEVRIVIQTKNLEDVGWLSTILVEKFITVGETNELIQNLRWLRERL